MAILPQDDSHIVTLQTTAFGPLMASYEADFTLNETTEEVEIKEVWTTYPVTLVQARYRGTYEGASWLAFPVRPDQLGPKANGWDASDLECSEFWTRAHMDPSNWCIGYGHTPDAAYKALIGVIHRYGTPGRG